MMAQVQQQSPLPLQLSIHGATDVAAALNQANQVLAAPVGVTFGVDDNGNITTTYDDALGDIADRRVVNLAESGTSMATNLAAASSGVRSQFNWWCSYLHSKT